MRTKSDKGDKYDSDEEDVKDHEKKGSRKED